MVNINCITMAIQKIGGNLLENNLVRVADLAFQTDLLYLDIDGSRIGIRTDAPGNYALDVNGTARFQDSVTITGDLTVVGTTTTVDSQNLSVEDNILVINSNNSAATSAGIMINRGGANDPAVFYWDETNDVFKVGTTTADGSSRTDLSGVTLTRMQAADPVGDDDLLTKRYFDDNASAAVLGSDISLGTTEDSGFGDGALLTLGDAPSVTDAIDDLNEVIDNIRAGTYVKSVNFTANNTSGSLGLSVTLTITTVGGGASLRYDVNWGDGTVDTNLSSASPSHTYNENSGTPYTVTVTARSSTASTTGSAGSFATSTRSNYITIYTSLPVVNFFIYSGASGGSPITYANNGSTVYLENTTTNTAGATVTYSVDWGDGITEAIASDSAAGGVSGTRLSHTYTNSGADDGSTIAGTSTGDTRYRIRLVLESHNTADPAAIPAGTNKNFDVYSLHTVAYSVADSTIRGINQEATGGFSVTFTNNTATYPGAQSTFTGNIYTWNFGEGDANTSVNVGSAAAGDTNQNITNLFNLSSGQQAAGTTVTYTTSLSLATNHTSSPFTANLNIIVEPDVRANIAATAVTVSDRTGDTQYSLYDFTDLLGNNRAMTRFTNTSQNASNYEYDFYGDSSSITSIVEDGSTAGTIGNTLDKNFTGASVGTITTEFRAYGTPGTIAQDDQENITWTMKTTPAAPTSLSGKSITLSTAAQGTSPKLCALYTDNSGLVTLSAGASLNTTTARRYTSTTPIQTSTVDNAYNAATGTLTAKINGADSGNKTFTTATGENGTFTSLIVSGEGDARTTVGAASYPSNFYQTFDAQISQALTSYSVGVNDERLEHSTTGNTNYVSVVRDDVTSTPTTVIGTVAEGTAGTKRYISGIPYYNTGSPTVNITGTTVANFTGQAYQDTVTPVQVTAGTNQDGGAGSTSGNVLSANPTSFTYSGADGSTSMLSGGIPKANTGVSSPYTLGTLSCALTSSSVATIQTIKALAKNANGDGSYSETATRIQVFTSSPTGLNNEAGGITVSDSLGNGTTHVDDAVRITGFGTASDTPSFFDSSLTNYYTDHAWSGAETVAGTSEAIIRPSTSSAGKILHFTTDLSTGYLPVGPDLNTGRSGAQYFTFVFRRTPVSQFSITMSGKVSGMFIAAPGTTINTTSTLNGWLDCSTQYAGAGVPGAGVGGNGSNGCAKTGGDRVVDGTTYTNEVFTFTLGTESLANALGNNCLVRIKLESGDSITALSVGVAE
jgi:hypothetical protein